MRIKSISTRNFAKHAAIDVSLPRAGIVLVTGKNGHGKSTIAEAVAQCLWNKSIRGEPGWREGAKSGVLVEFEGGHVNRAIAKTKHALSWSVGEFGAGDYSTRSKSQAELESHIGSFNVWRHACVFHTKDASIFTEATDASRKRLLEEVLELDRVERAYRNGLKEAAAVAKQVTTAEHTVALLRAEANATAEQLTVVSGMLEARHRRVAGS